MKRVDALVLTLLISGGTPYLAVSAPVVEVKKEYYWVSGNTEYEIRNDLNAKTPNSDNGNKFDAYTRWYVKWNLWRRESGGSCEIERVTTKVEVSYILPRLRASSSIPEPLKAKWKSYKAALLRHEDAHKEFGVKAADEIEQGILGMGPRKTCEELETDANHLGRSTLEKYRRVEKEYDRQTDHGRNDGAVFP